MPARVATITIGLQWTPPGSALNTGNSNISLQSAYNAQNVGSIDVPIAQSIATVFDIPFGSVGSAKVLVIQNQMTSDIGVRLNGHGSNDFNLAPGGFIAIGESLAPSLVPLDSAEIVTTASPTAIEQVNYWIMGD